MLSLVVLRFSFLPVLLFLSTSHLVNGQPAGYSYSSSSSSSSSTGQGGTRAGAGPSRVRIIIQNGRISTIFSGPITGSVSSRVDENGVYINFNGQIFQSSDTIGPYVVTNEPDGVLKRKEFTPEDAEMIRKQQEQFQQQMNAMNNRLQQQMNAMNNQFQNSWNRMASQMSQMMAGMKPPSIPPFPHKK